MATQSPARPERGEPGSSGIAREGAARDGVDPTKVPPLEHSPDPTALDDSFGPITAGNHPDRGIATDDPTRGSVDGDGDGTIGPAHQRTDTQ
ncbi:hypothetical protein [Halosolutus halophilus]|uniref:hypothetical protein n=1 Tax=Halosolutus halophilus TaxID=1552990 RepID=UPI00223506C7|nr:hypothetical protein [Halosolutus halophilus]